MDYDIWLCMANIPRKFKLDLIKTYHSSKEIWDVCVLGDERDSRISRTLRCSWDQNKIDTVKRIIFNNNIKILNFNDGDYPEKLRNLEDAPVCLFYKGNISLLNERINVALVGSRKCTTYGMNVTKVISAELSKNKINVISGMAKGIDSHAHFEALSNNNYTCAVLGCGTDIIYPKENKVLYEKICQSGCVLSEFLPGTQPLAYNFPTRNRIISGLSDLVIIVEADIKSGSLITASAALEQGKDVMAVPGSIISNQSKGSNKLIKDGAYPLTCIDDIFELIDTTYVQSNINQYNPADNIEKKIYDTLNDNPIHIDDIYRITNIDIKHLYEVLFELQLKDEIMCLTGNYYVKLNKKI
jgi:DNA processing protein